MDFDRIMAGFFLEEDSLMNFVNDLVAADEASIIHECQLRCERLFESRQNAHRAFSNALSAIEILDDDIIEPSIHVVDSPLESDNSVEFIGQVNYSPPGSDIEIIDETPSTSVTKTLKLPEVKEEPPPDTKKGVQECSICLEPLRKVKEISSTTCGHIFCTACIKDSLKTKKKCPICRAGLNLKKIHPLFLF